MRSINNPALKRTIGILIAFTGWSAIILQLLLMLKTNNSNGIAAYTTFINFFSFFTILSNILVAVSLTCSLIFPSANAGIFFSRHSSQSGIMLYIMIVGIVYSLALRNIWNPQGLQLVADRLLHDLIPLLFFIYWLMFTPKKVLKWGDIISWLPFPAAFLIYSLIRGAIVNWYPYYFINAQQLGYEKVVINSLMVLAAFVIIGLLLVFINRLGKVER